MQVAIDTSTNTASLALVQDGDIMAELTWHCEQSHSTQLLPSLSYLLKQNNLNLQSATCISVARGPGSYNGLRVGLSTAKALAFSLNVPIISIGTLEAEAYQQANTGLPICAVLNAGRGEIAIAKYQKKRGSWLELAPAQLTTLDVLCSEVTTKTVFCGEYIPAIAHVLTERLDSKAVIPAPPFRLRRASFLAELADKRFKNNDYDNVVTLQPIYLRGPEITLPKHHT